SDKRRIALESIEFMQQFINQFIAHNGFPEEASNSCNPEDAFKCLLSSTIRDFAAMTYPEHIIAKHRQDRRALKLGQSNPNISELPDTVQVQVAQHLIPQMVQRISNIGHPSWETFVSEKWAVIGRAFDTEEMAPYIQIAVQARKIMQDELTQLDYLQEFLGRVLFARIVQALELDDEQKPGLYKDQFLPAFRQVTGNTDLRQYNLAGRDQVVARAKKFIAANVVSLCELFDESAADARVLPANQPAITKAQFKRVLTLR
ncbi:MAG TPA: hypothetical protein VLG38_00060, partial [Gammaproteobacteria bacterium]|nr:hypothetical protein [Gammaproteobacteria bacterium]